MSKYKANKLNVQNTFNRKSDFEYYLKTLPINSDYIIVSLTI